jgi:uncharacterized protein (DUF1015 family)
MAVIGAFRGLRYNPETIEDLSLVVAPPYDVISPEGQRGFHARHPFNVIRLILGETLEGDDAERNRYTRAGEYFRRWQAEKVLVREERPSLYLYEQTFHVPETGPLARRGLIALVRLEEFGSRTIFPHERTMAAPKEDRLLLMRACHANLSPIFGVYPGPFPEFERVGAEVGATRPAIDLRDWEGIRHRVWICQDPEVIGSLQSAFDPTPILIADGHHRYETALAFRDLMRAGDSGTPDVVRQRPYNFVMMTLVSAEDPGLIILPIHRLIREIPGGTIDAYLTLVTPHFSIETVPVPDDAEGTVTALLVGLKRAGRGPHRFALYAGGNQGILMTLANEAAVEQIVEGTPKALKRLDVTILHALLIDRPLRAHARAVQPDDVVAYTHDATEAIRAVKNRHWGAAFLVNPTRISEVQEVATAGLRMPPKSTFFYPKLLTGLVINPLLPEEIIESPA